MRRDSRLIHTFRDVLPLRRVFTTVYQHVPLDLPKWPKSHTPNADSVPRNRRTGFMPNGTHLPGDLCPGHQYQIIAETPSEQEISRDDYNLGQEETFSSQKR